jgi:hypothetical protein
MPTPSWRRKGNIENFECTSIRAVPLKVIMKAFGQTMAILGEERTVELPYLKQQLKTGVKSVREASGDGEKR